MKRIIAIIAILALLAMPAWAGPKISKNGGGSVATDTIWDAAGDLAIGTGANTAGRLAVGATNTLLYVNSDTPAWLALGAANTVLTSNGSALSWAATHSHSDSAAQFYNATNTSRLIKADASGITADSKTYTIKPITDVDVTFSPGKTFTDTKWCSFGTATGLTCNEDAPAGSGDITAVGSCATGSCASIGNADTSGGYIDFLEDSDNGTNYVRLKAPDSTADATITLPGTTGTLAILGANTFTGNQTLDDGTGASPTLTFQDATNETAIFEKADAGFLTITTVAGDGVNVVTGNLKVGNGTPTQTQDGEDTYLEGMLEVDGVIYADGGITGATASDPYIKLDETDGTDWWIGIDDTGNSLEFRTNVAVGNTVRMELYESTGLLVTPPSAQTIAAGNTVAADACGTIKQITAAGAVTTATDNTFTAPAAANAGCCMDVINVGAEAITLDNNALFISAGGADVVLGAGDTVRVCSTGASGKWYQIGATGNN